MKKNREKRNKPGRIPWKKFVSNAWKSSGKIVLLALTVLAEEAQEAEEEEERMDVAFDEDGNFAVQVEAWRSRRKAEEQIEKWQNRGFENAFVVQHGNEDTGDVWFRVRLGRLSTQEAARNLQAQIKENYGANSWISTAQ